MSSETAKNGNAAEIDRLALALAKEPGSKAFIPLAEEYSKAGMWQEAAAVLEDGLKAYPNFITAMVALGRAYDQLNLPIKAKAVLEEAIRLSPENLRAHRTLAKLYVLDGATDAALRSCAAILAANPQDQEALSIHTALVAAQPRGVNEPAPTSERRQEAVPLLEPSTENLAPAANAKPAIASLEYARSTGKTPWIPDNVPAQSSAMTTSPAGREMYLRRLERWLAAIQARRRSLSSVPSPS